MNFTSFLKPRRSGDPETDYQRQMMMAQVLQGMQAPAREQTRIVPRESFLTSALPAISQVLGAKLGADAQTGLLKAQKDKRQAALAELLGQGTQPTTVPQGEPGAASIPQGGQGGRYEEALARALAAEEAGVPQTITKAYLDSKKPGESFSLSPGQTRYSADGKPLVSVPDKPDKGSTEWQDYLRNKEQGYGGTFLEYQLGMKRAGATNVSQNVNPSKYPNAFNEALGKADVERLTGYQKAAESSAAMLQTLDQMEQLNATAMSGGGAKTRADVANWISGWTGMDVSDPDKLADTQVYNSLATKSILDSLGGSLGAGVSNADVAFIKETVPQLEFSQEARQKLIDFMRKKATQNIDIYDRARAYGEQNQGLKGFRAFDIEGPKTKSPSLISNPDGSYTYKRK